MRAPQRRFVLKGPSKFGFGLVEQRSVIRLTAVYQQPVRESVAGPRFGKVRVEFQRTLQHLPLFRNVRANRACMAFSKYRFASGFEEAGPPTLTRRTDAEAAPGDAFSSGLEAAVGRFGEDARSSVSHQPEATVRRPVTAAIVCAIRRPTVERARIAESTATRSAIPRSSNVRSLAVCQRSSGSFARHRATTRSRAGGESGWREETAGGVV